MNKCPEVTSRVPAKTRVSELHAHLVCVLCGGYYVDATTIVECLHTFCRSCIVRYLETSKFCPMCDVQVHKTKPLVNLRADKTLQDLVYKVVPCSYASEMQRRRDYYEKLKEKGVDTEKIPPEDRGEPEAPEFFSPEDSISLSLEYYTGEEIQSEESKAKEDGVKVKTEAEVKKERENNHKRFLQCPAAVGMRHLKKFIRLKFGLSPDYKVDIIYEGECLKDEFTLMDVAYTFSWKRNSAMRFYYRIYERPKYVPKFTEVTADRTVTDNNDEPPMKRPRLLSSDSASTPSNSTSNSAPASSTDQKPSQPPAEPIETTPPPSTPTSEKPELVEPEVVKKKEEKRSRSRSTELQRLEAAAAPIVRPKTPVSRPKTPVSRPKTPVSRPKTPVSRPKTPVSRPKTPKPPKEKKDTPRAESKRDSSTSTPKTMSQPPKPIMPGQKPPSQTALLLQQRIIQQRQQQQQKLQLQKQQQQKLIFQKQQQMGMHQRQIPQLNKIQASPKQMQQIKINRTTSPATTVTKSPSVSTSTQSTSKHTMSVQTSLNSTKPQTPVVSKPATPSPSVTKPSVTTSAPTKPAVSTPVASKPSTSQPVTNKPVQTATPKPSPNTSKVVPTPMKQTPNAVKPSPNTTKPSPIVVKPSPVVAKPSPSPAQPNGKPVSSPTSPKLATTNTEPRRNDNLIDKDKMSPVVVIERHQKKSQSGDKSSPTAQKDKNPPPVKPKQSKIGPETTLTVAPGGSDTKLRLIKRPATSPASGAPVAKKAASDTPKPANMPSLMEPLEIRTSGDKPRHDDFGALDLSGKSSRKSDSPCSSHGSEAASPPAPSPPEPRTSPAPKPTQIQPTPPPPRSQNSSMKPSKSSSPQTIMSIAQTLVNRQLSNLGFNGEGGRSPGSPHSQGSSSPSSISTTGVGTGMSFRNLMTLSDTAVQLRNSMHSPPQPQYQHRAPTPQPRMRLPTPQQHTSVRPTYSKTSSSSGNIKNPTPPSIRIPTVPNMSKSSPPVRENNPMMSPSRVSRINDIFPAPSQVKPGPNQSVRHIPNPALLFRQQANRMQQQSQPPSCKDEITITPAKNPSNPPLSSIRKIENLTRNIGEGKAVNAAGLGARATAEATQ